MTQPLIRWFSELGRGDVSSVGGKNASLGEMIGALAPDGIRVPDGFATTAAAYRLLIAEAGLEVRIRDVMARRARGEIDLPAAGAEIRRAFRSAPLPERLVAEIRAAYLALGERAGRRDLDVAVRSSATAEDLPEASFAGQQESFLNIHGEGALLDACSQCYASLFTDRAIVYREEMGFDHIEVALSIGVQRMVRSDMAGAGVMFTLDTETGFPDTIIIDAAWGLGENIVKGSVTPDEYAVFKPLLDKPDLQPILSRKLGAKERKLIYAGGGKATKNVPTTAGEQSRYVLSDDEVLTLGRWAARIEAHYGMPMDIEWAKDGHTGELFIVQARPETVEARRISAGLTSVVLRNPPAPVLSGIGVGRGVATGPVRIIDGPEAMAAFRAGEILVAGMTDPDWVPLMRRAAAIVTDRGGRTCHAAIVSRELGVAAVVGTREATARLRDGDIVTVACTEGSSGAVYPGAVAADETTIDTADLPATRTQLMVNIGSPDAAWAWWRLPADGIGLARMEFLISNRVRVHPMALLQPDRVQDDAALQEIAALTRGFADGGAYFVDTLASGIAEIAASRWPQPVILRMSDFKTNEYADLIGGRAFEPAESNPMLGFRGASRYYHERYRAGFELECRAVRKVREEIGLTNVIVMIPFCRTPQEADRVLAVMAAAGLERGRHGLEVYVMCEIPANVILTEAFAERFDGFSIGSNDLTQLVLGVDRDSELLADLFDERDDAVKTMIADVIRRAHAAGRKVGICGQAPSDHPGFAEFLVAAGIDSISLSPDKLIDVRRRVAAAEAS
jgi:pyruvate,water dikinase